MGKQGLFYYYHTMAKALSLAGIKSIQSKAGEARIGGKNLLLNFSIYSPVKAIGLTNLADGGKGPCFSYLLCHARLGTNLLCFVRVFVSIRFFSFFWASSLWNTQ